MFQKFKYTWILIPFIADLLKPVNVQFAMPMFPAPPPPICSMPMCPMPMPVPLLPIAIPGRGPDDMRSSSKKTTTTTTTKKPETVAVGIPVPVPMPMPMPMPMPVPMCVPALPPNSYQRPTQRPTERPKNCPPCPPCVCSPSCTPSFFSYCSPCHMKCRCKNKEDAPEPLPNRPAQGPAYGLPVPIPAVMPPPVVMVPYPPPILVPRQDRYRPKKDRKPISSSCSDDSTQSTSSESDFYQRKRRHKKRKRFGGHRRSLRSSDSDNELVKPMLSYIADNGDVKFKTKISGDDVAELLGEKEDLTKNYHTVRVMTGEDENSKPKALVVSNKSGKRKRQRYKKVLLRQGVNHVLEDGRKELIFRPPGNKKISNLSVSFQLS